MFPDRKPMLLVKKRNFFSFFFFLLKIRVEIILNNFVEKKETFLDHFKRTSLKSQNSDFSQEVHPCFWSKNAIFLSICFQSKKGLEVRFNDVLDRKETCFDYKNKIFKRLKNRIFPMLLVKKWNFVFWICSWSKKN